MRSIRIHVPGGLGNQLFAYFSALFFARENSSSLIVCIDTIDRSHSGGNSNIASFNLFPNRIDFRRTTKYARLKNRILNGIKRRSLFFNYIIDYIGGYIAQSQSGFFEHDIAIFQNKIKKILERQFFNTVNLHGNFQNCELIQKLPMEYKQLTLMNPSNWFKSMEVQAKNKLPIVIHIRLGDYFTSPDFEKSGVLDVNYYINALRHVLDIFPGREIWILSNDINRAQKYFSKIKIFAVDNKLQFILTEPNADPAEELLLLTLGCAIICSNSTFSLISAMINPNDRIVVVPNKFYRSPNHLQFKYLQDWHLIKSEWMKINPERQD